MSEKKTLVESLQKFSQKFSKLTSDEQENAELPQSESKILQEEINRAEKTRIETLQKTFNEFVNPVTQEIEKDEESVVLAYKLFVQVKALNESSENVAALARIKSVVITASICSKTEYTGEGKQLFSFLKLWFLKENPDCIFVPEICRAPDGSFYLDFIERELWSPSVFEKEILQAVSSSFSL